MNILMLSSSYPLYAGETTAPFIEEIAAGLVQQGHAVTMVLPYHPRLARAPTERGVRIRPFRYAPHPAMNVWGYAQSMRADVGMRGAAVAVAPVALAAALGAVLRELVAGARAGQPYDLVHAHWVIPNGLPAMLAARALQRPLVVSMHGSDVHVAYRQAAVAPVAALVLRAARVATACSSELLARALAVGAPPGRTHLLPYGVDVRAFAPRPDAAMTARAALHVPPDAPLVVAVGRMVYKKGFGDLVDALPAILAQHPTAILVLVGYGELRPALEQQAARLGLGDRVRFTGQLERDRTAAMIAAADVYVVPSVRDQAGNIDGLPNTLLEGMAAARPVVATRTAGIPDVLVHETHGLLVPERAPLELAAAISRLLAQPALARRLGAAARTRVTAELTWDAIIARLQQFYTEA